ncbi:amino acid permease [bacterium]|nr:amino acid permease [bacterium]
MSDDTSDDGGLKRGLKPHHLQFISIGGIIGSAYFLGTGYVLAKAGPAAVGAYMLGGLLVYLVMLSLGELAVHIPTSGSFVTYANEFIHPAVGCGVGWSYWVNWVVFVPSEMIAAGIIMNHFVPGVAILAWAVLFGLILTALNLLDVGNFGEMEFWLCLIKVVAIAAFVLLALFIYFQGVAAGSLSPSGHLLTQGGLLPHGISSVFLTMVIILVNFQGTEIIGLAAGETKDPARSIPAAVNAVSYRIIALYVIPVFLLVTILPWQEAGLKDCVFALALDRYGLNWAAAALSFVVLTAAISCSNSGIYATSRALYSLAREGMAPAFLARVNQHGVPQPAILLTVVGCWLVLALQTLDKSGTFYQNLLAVSGFTGTVAWISICWAQLNFRRRLLARGFLPQNMKFRVPFFPQLTYFAIFAQAGCLLISGMSGDFALALKVSLVLLTVPTVAYLLTGRRRPESSTAARSFEKLIQGEPKCENDLPNS